MPDLFEAARARRTDPSTSHAAAASVRDPTAKQQMILGILKDRGPMCDQRIFTLVEGAMSQSGARTRRVELVAQGLVKDSGRKTRTDSGRATIIWEAV